MPRDITITFDDGSTHVYKNAPDTVTPETVQKRAEAQFGKSVKGIDGGKQSASVGAGNPPQEKGFLEKVRGAADSVLEPIATIASGMVAAPVAGFAGMAGDIYSGLTGEPRIGDQVNADVQKAMTYQPRSEGGKENLAAVGKALDASKLAGLPIAGQELPMLGRAIQQQAPLVKSVLGSESSLLGQAGKTAIEKVAPKSEYNVQAVADSGNQGALLDNIALMRKHEMAVNPNSTNPVLKNRAGAALVGDTGLNRGAYQINQPKANALAREDLGIPEGTPLTKPAYDDVKQGFVDVSKEVQDIPLFKTDKQYLDGLNEKSFIAELPEAEQALLKNSRQVNALLEKAALPEITGNGAIAIMRELRAKSSKVLNNPTADPAATALANAQRNVAKQIEAMIERRLDGMGKTDLAQRFKDERTLYAKAKAYESVTTPNGDINVPKLPSGKGHTSYTDNLKDLTDMGAAFPEAFTPPPKSGTGLNLTYGGRLNTALDILSTPVKNKMLSDAYQAKNASPPDFRIQPFTPEPPKPHVLAIDDSPLPQSPQQPMPQGRGLLSLADEQQTSMPYQPQGAIDFPLQNRPVPIYQRGGIPVESGLSLSAPEPRIPTVPYTVGNVPKGRGLLSLTDELPISSKSNGWNPHEKGTVDFKLRQQVMDDLAPTTDALRQQLSNLMDRAERQQGFWRNRTQADIKRIEEYFRDGLKQIGIDKPSDAWGQAIYSAGGETKLPIQKSGRSGMMTGAKP
jgi:hypothetical protein